MFAAGYGCLMPLAAFVAFVFLLSAVSRAPETWKPWLFGVLGLAWLSIGASMLVFPACPRCGYSPYLWAKGWAFSSFPRSRCSKCGLDLRKFGLFDPRAKREPHV